MDLTTFQKMDEMEKKLFISRIVNICNADEKSFGVISHHLELQEQRLKDNHVQIATNFPTITIP